MYKTPLAVLMVLALVLGSVAFGQDERPKTKRANSSKRVVRQRPQNLSPEERARLREQYQNMTPEERAEFRAKMRERLDTDAQGKAVDARRRAAIAQIAKLKQQHQATVAELQAIRQLATEENAPQTAKRLEQLIARHEKRYAQQMQMLEKRLQGLRAGSARQPDGGGKAGAERPKRGSDRPIKGRRAGREKVDKR